MVNELYALLAVHCISNDWKYVTFDFFIYTMFIHIHNFICVSWRFHRKKAHILFSKPIFVVDVLRIGFPLSNENYDFVNVNVIVWKIHLISCWWTQQFTFTLMLFVFIAQCTLISIDAWLTHWSIAFFLIDFLCRHFFLFICLLVILFILQYDCDIQ